MKKITLLKSVLLLILAIGSISTYAQQTYTLVTSNSELVSGGKYLIVSTATSGSGYALGLQNANNRASVAITVSSNSISTTAATATTDTKPFEITLGGSTGTWTLYDAVNATYLRPRTGANNGLQGNTVSQNWTISVAGTGIATMTCENTTTYPRNILRFNSTNVPPIFACYSTGQSDVYLYKLSAPTQAATPTFNPVAGTYTSAQSVSLSSTTSGAHIYYTVDGSDPSSASTEYTTPISVATTTTVKAIAYDASNANASSIATALYTINIAPTPTITVTEVSIPEMVTTVGTPVTETINVSGTNLTGNITLDITGTNATQFNVSPTPLIQSGGSVSSTTVTITYNPLTAGTHTATLELSSAGATTVTRTLNGTATSITVPTPVATTATSVSNTGFTANWDAVSGATSYLLNVYTQTAGANATDLFISEYGEGSGGNKKYIEIFNGTGSTVDLATYTIKKAVNGAGWNATIYNFPTSTTIANNATYVVANNSTDVIGANDYNSTFVTWNGDDAIGLFKNDVLIDVFGTPDTYPGTGWDVAGTTNATVDHIIIRKPSVNSPSTDWTASAGTTVENSQWIVSTTTYTTTDQTTNLGAHTMSGGVSTTPVSGSPFTITAPTTSLAITGLTQGTTYYYNLTAINGSISSELSNTISATTGTGTSIVNNKIENISASNGKVRFDAKSGENIEIYNSLGQRIVQQMASEGQNIINVMNVKGVIIVKVGNKTAKVVL